MFANAITALQTSAAFTTNATATRASTPCALPADLDHPVVFSSLRFAYAVETKTRIDDAEVAALAETIANQAAHALSLTAYDNAQRAAQVGAQEVFGAFHFLQADEPDAQFL